MADTEGNMADTRFGGAAKADTRRTSSGKVARAYRGQLFFLFLRENPTVKCLGNKNQNNLLDSHSVCFLTPTVS